MTATRTKLVALALAGAAAQAAAAELVMIEWDADGRYAKALTVPATQPVEVCGKLPAHARVRWRFEADARLSFNIHYHEGNDVRYPTRRARVAKGDGTLGAKVEHDYCWMWTNRSKRDASLRLQLERLPLERLPLARQ